MNIIVIKEGWRGRKIGDTGEVMEELGKQLIADGYVKEFFGTNRELEAIRSTFKEEVKIPVSVPDELDNNLKNDEDAYNGNH